MTGGSKRPGTTVEADFAMPMTPPSLTSLCAVTDTALSDFCIKGQILKFILQNYGKHDEFEL